VGDGASKLIDVGPEIGCAIPAQKFSDGDQLMVRVLVRSP